VLKTQASVNKATIEAQRRLRGAQPKTKIPASVNPPVAAHTLGAALFEALCEAVVVKVNFVEPLPVTEAGVNVQPVDAGKWVQPVKFTVPL
jgi:hypothetical protein